MKDYKVITPAGSIYTDLQTAIEYKRLYGWFYKKIKAYEKI